MSRYRVLNRTKQTLVASQVELAESGWARMKGLLGRSAAEFPSGKGLWIAPAQGVHTIGMSFPIDVVYMDSCGRVIRLYHKLAPFRVAAVKLSARSVLELAAGTLLGSRTTIGDVLEITQVDEI